MTDKFGMSVRQAAELDHAFERNGWYPPYVKKLCKGDLLKQVLDVLYGRAKIVDVDHIVNFDTEPFIPKYLSLAPLSSQLPVRMSGNFIWSDFNVMALVIQASTAEGLWIPGRRALGAQLLDYMLKYPYLIPMGLEGRRIHFWGTVYHNESGSKCIRSLYLDGLEPKEARLHFTNLEEYKATGPSFV